MLLARRLRKALEKVQEINGITWGVRLQHGPSPADEQAAMSDSKAGPTAARRRQSTRNGQAAGEDGALLEPLLTDDSDDLEAGMAAQPGGVAVVQAATGAEEEANLLRSEKVGATAPAQLPASRSL